MKQQPLRRTSFTALAALTAAALLPLVGGCDQMADQPRHEAYEKSEFFADGQSSRPLVAGTVHRGRVHDGSRTVPLYPDKQPLAAVDANDPGFPVTITDHVLKRGQEQFTIYCSICHGATGDGRGMIVQRGFTPPPAFYPIEIDKTKEPIRYQRGQVLLTAPPKHLYDVISNGYGAMFSYGDRVAPEDRWAIAAYIKALQLSRHADPAQLAADDLAHVQGKAQ